MADPNVPYYLARPDEGLTPQQIADLQEIQKLIPPYYEQVGEGIFYDPRFGTFYSVEKNANPGQPTQRYNPETGEIETVPGSKGNFILQKATDSQAKYLRGNLGYPDGGSTQRLASDDPRYWQFQYDQLNEQAKEHVDQLAYDYYNTGMTAENARRQALSQFISNRDSLASSTANTSANVAKQIADYAASPRDTYAEAVYRNQVGGSTPFGDLQNQAFGDYGKALQQKGVNIFQNVAGDLDKSRQYRDALPLQDWLPADLRGSTGAGQPAASPAASAPAGAAGPSAQDLINAYNAYHPNAQMPGTFYGFNSPEEAQAMAKYFAAKAQQPSQGGGGMSPPPGFPAPLNLSKTAGSATPMVSTSPVDMPLAKDSGSYAPRQFAAGGTIDFGNMTRFGEGHQPSSSEGGLQLNIHELAHIVGQSGHVYASLGEGGYPEQVKITPTASGKKAAQAAEKAGKSLSGTMKNNAATGGTASVDPSLDEMNDQYSQLLARLGGQGGGSNTPFGGARFLAGAPANALLNDPFLKGVTEARYSTLPSLGGAGLAPEDLWAQIAKFTPSGITNNSPRTSFA